MVVVVFVSVDCHFELFGDILACLPDFGADVFADRITPIFRDEDQVCVELVEDVAAGAPIFRQGHCGNIDQPARLVTVTPAKLANSGRSYRAYLTGGSEQARVVAQVDGSCRVIGRLAIERHEMRGSMGRRNDKGRAVCPRSASGELTELRLEVPWLAEVPVHALQQELACVERAFENWRAGRASYPTPRKRHQGVRIKFADPKDWRVEKVAGRRWRIRLPKQLGWFEFVKHRPFGGNIKSVTLSYKAGRWAVSFGIAQRKPEATTKPGICGVDVGVTETVATSRPVDLGDGRGPQRLHRMPALLSAGEKAYLCRLELRAGTQTEVRKRRRSKITISQRKTYQAIGRVHARIGRRRNAWLRLVAAQLGEFGTVVFENIPIPNLTRRAKPKPDPDQPGQFLPNGQAAKAGLNRAILNSGWGYLRTFTAEKTQTVKVPSQYTSQDCRACGHRDPANRPHRDQFRCVACGHSNHADLNASENIEARGSRVLTSEATALVVAAHSRKTDGTKERKARAA